MCKEHTKYKQYYIYKEQAYLGPIYGTQVKMSLLARKLYCLFYQPVFERKRTVKPSQDSD